MFIIFVHEVVSFLNKIPLLINKKQTANYVNLDFGHNSNNLL